jgi:hypothetical protein
MEKTYFAGLIIDDCEEEIFVMGKTKQEAIDKLINTYGFDPEQIIIYHAVSEEYADMLGYDTY